MPSLVVSSAKARENGARVPADGVEPGVEVVAVVAAADPVTGPEGDGDSVAQGERAGVGAGVDFAV
jgi:hypothetical protein